MKKIKRNNIFIYQYEYVGKHISAHMHIHTFACLFICTLLFSCAQIVNPGGGAVDRTAPKTMKYIPDSAATSFKSKQIHIFFNEYIQLKDVSSQLIISPPLKQQPDVRVKNKELVISIEDTLASNTTYAFNFGSSIADLTEGNTIDNFQYVFSTGPFIDSLALTGVVMDAFTLNPVKGVLVMLYNTFEDSVPLKKLPNYFGKTKEDGSFRINNIRNGKYKVFALKDANSNYLYDSQEESIAFLETLVDIQKNSSVNLFLFKEIPKKQFIKRAAAIAFGHIQIAFNKPVTELQIQPLNIVPLNNDWKLEKYNKTRDTLDLWLPGFEKDSIRFIISDDKKLLDTLEIAFPLKISKGRGSKFQLTYKTNAVSGLFDLNKKFELQFSHPLKREINPLSVTILEDSVPIDENGKHVYATSDGFVSMGLEHDKYKGLGKYHWKENTNYLVRIMKDSVQDIFGLKNDTIIVRFKTQEIRHYGNLRLKVVLPSVMSNVLLSVINDKGNVILDSSKLIKSDVVEFAPMPSGSYRFRLVYNTIDNSVWDTGNYFKHQQPEKVIYSNPITIRSNWDIEQEWKISE